MSEMPEGVLEKIREAEEEQLKELDLSARFTGPDKTKLSFIPPEVFDLTSLEVLDLSRNSITTIPDAISQLRSLKILSLRRNALTAVSDAIGQLGNLSELSLWSDNDKPVQLPVSLGQLKNITSLDLVGFNLNEVPEWIIQLDKLSQLNLSANRLSALPSWIDQLQNLTVFWSVIRSHPKTG